jgi:hypothetical protein
LRCLIVDVFALIHCQKWGIALAASWFLIGSIFSMDSKVFSAAFKLWAFEVTWERGCVHVRNMRPNRSNRHRLKVTATLEVLAGGRSIPTTDRATLWTTDAKSMIDSRAGWYLQGGWGSYRQVRG